MSRSASAFASAAVLIAIVHSLALAAAPVATIAYRSQDKLIYLPVSIKAVRQSGSASTPARRSDSLIRGSPAGSVWQ